MPDPTPEDELRHAVLLELAEHLGPEQLERAKTLDLEDLVALLASIVG